MSTPGVPPTLSSRPSVGSLAAPHNGADRPPPYVLSLSPPPFALSLSPPFALSLSKDGAAMTSQLDTPIGEMLHSAMERPPQFVAR